MPGNHAIVAIDQHRISPAKLFDGRRDLSDSGLRMSAGIASVRDEVFKRALLDTGPDRCLREPAQTCDHHLSWSTVSTTSRGFQFQVMGDDIGTSIKREG